MGKHKKNKPTPSQVIKEGDPVPDFTKGIESHPGGMDIMPAQTEGASQDLPEVSHLPDDEFKEEEKIVENLEDMPLPLGDIDPVEMKQLTDPEFEKLTPPPPPPDRDPDNPTPPDSIKIKSFAQMLRERRAKRSKI